MTIKMLPSSERETQPVKRRCFSQNVAGLAPYTCWFAGVWVKTCPITLLVAFMRHQIFWCTKVWRSRVFTVIADLEGVTLRAFNPNRDESGNHRNGTETLPVSAVFVFIGAEPGAEWLPDAVARDPLGYVLTGVDA